MLGFKEFTPCYSGIESFHQGNFVMYEESFLDAFSFVKTSALIHINFRLQIP